eukprot:7250167-Lingulodinium_polyedra.AAC.1
MWRAPIVPFVEHVFAGHGVAVLQVRGDSIFFDSGSPSGAQWATGHMTSRRYCTASFGIHEVLQRGRP